MPSSPSPLRGTEQRGTALVLGTYVLWGLFPLYFRLLAAADAVEIIGYRITFTALTCLSLVALTRGWGRVRAVLADPGQVLVLAVSGLLITLNWLTYVYGVNTGRAADAALGYFINPLVTVALAALVLGERLRRAQGVAIVLAVVAVVVTTRGQVPWISLALAVTFGLYGLVKNQARTDPLTGLTLESCLVLPLGAGYLAHLAATGASTLQGPQGSAVLAVLLVLAGPVTALPLLLFAAGARRVPLSTVGLVQYVSPIMQFLLAWLVLGEEISPSRWVSMVLIWVATAVFSVDLVVQMRSLPGGRRG
ncbi:MULTISPECIES: EamA family transporter RarD [unclassified Actinomyces]|uniref:EamA family transporter RarD n=1 Tax=unclassified Actinomyces TaxID=2609248 RepID=UPI002017D631|nr:MULTISPECIES: EamA family transporter RarD [unclassified Actinomyces]MCL3778702.1 EamA family transporter RarD [Actinomyces sp. AC-20-1]MCL3790796.1 EamA family transporter RarD [Actinomyces sp. 187325]MCL3793082.1 EamA family transporter RarD [Actinomyces sp. 186855]MCL3795490.1 EamA family transporter RarD [Actinomyces sp. 217892]